MTLTATTYRGTYGGTPCTLSPMPTSPYGSWYMAYDRDPGCGPMAFPVGHGVTITGLAHKCPDCGVHLHASAWPCTATHGDTLAPVPAEAVDALTTALLAAGDDCRTVRFYIDALALVRTPAAAR